MTRILAAGQERMFSTCIRNRRAQPAMGRDMQTGSAKRPSTVTARGFTLIELMIVVSIIMILIGIAAGAYLKSVQRAKEATLKSDLSVMRRGTTNFTAGQAATAH